MERWEFTNPGIALSPPAPVKEMSLCFTDARDDPKVGVIILTGEQDSVSDAEPPSGPWIQTNNNQGPPFLLNR